MTRPATDPWHDVSAARLPLGGLTALAPVRDRADVRVALAGAVAWVRWPAGRAEVVRCLLSVQGVAFFSRRGGEWFPFGRHLPTDEAPPDGDGGPVAAVLAPARFEPVAPAPPTWAPVVLGVVRGGGPQPVTAVACSVKQLAQWADGATTAELAAVRGARSGERVVLLGDRLPTVPGALRYWGAEVLVPLGFRPDPDLPEPVLREAAGAAATELLLLDTAGAVAIPRDAFEPLTRAGVRLGARSA